MPLELGDRVFGENFYQQYFFDKYSFVMQVRMSHSEPGKIIRVNFNSPNVLGFTEEEL